MRIALIILNAFATLWALFALGTMQAPPLTFIAPVGVSALILFSGWSIVSASPARPHYRRIVRIWSAIEGAALLLALIVLQAIGAPEYIPPAFSMIVGLHFIPLARGFPQPIYYWTGTALTLVGAISATLSSPHLKAVVPSSAGALILWASAIALVVSARSRPSGGLAAD